VFVPEHERQTMNTIELTIRALAAQVAEGTPPSRWVVDYGDIARRSLTQTPTPDSPSLPPSPTSPEPRTATDFAAIWTDELLRDLRGKRKIVTDALASIKTRGTNHVGFTQMLKLYDAAIAAVEAEASHV